MIEHKICSLCKGKKYIFTDICNSCNGFGMKSEALKHKITLPLGCVNKQFAVFGMGNIENTDQTPGVLVINCRLKNSNEYVLENNTDFINIINIDPVEAMIGCEKKVKILDDTEIILQIPRSCEQGYRQYFPNLGLYIDANQRGNLVTIIKYKMPDKLNSEQETILRQYIDSKDKG